MASRLEHTVASLTEDGKQLQDRLSGYLNARDLRSLRSTCQLLKIYADKHGQAAFRSMYLHAPVRNNANVQILDNIGPFCTNLTITIGLPKDAPPDTIVDKANMQSLSKKGKLRANALRRLSIVKKLWSSSLDLIIPGLDDPQPIQDRPENSQSRHPDEILMDLRLWTSILTQFPIMTTLTLRCPDADPIWPGRTLVEETLTILRVCLERVRPRKLHALTCSPIHAMGIIHLRSSSFGSFLELVPRKNLWRNLTTLDLRIPNPLPNIDAPKSRMFLSILHDYLHVFAPNLRVLKFIWIGPTAGPSPFRLLEGLQNNPPRQAWPRLESFWFGNITFPNLTISLLADIAPNCRTVRALRSTHRFSRIDEDHVEPWYDVTVRSSEGWTRASLVASSIYSQLRGRGKGEEGQSMVSRTSRVVPFILDVKAQGKILPSTRYQG